jgi:hypothetical protein
MKINAMTTVVIPGLAAGVIYFVIAFATGASAVASIISGIVVVPLRSPSGSSFEQFTNAGPRAPTTRLPSRLHPRGLTRHTADRWGSPIGEPFRPHRLGSGSVSSVGGLDEHTLIHDVCCAVSLGFGCSPRVLGAAVAAFLTRALKGPTPRESIERLAERAWAASVRCLRSRPSRGAAQPRTGGSRCIRPLGISPPVSFSGSRLGAAPRDQSSWFRRC